MRFKLSFTIPTVAAISFCVIGGTNPAAADILYVPGDFRTIQEAIDAAVDGDSVRVAAGTYNEAIDFLGKAITVYGPDGPDVTIIDATGLNSSVVKCVNFEGLDTVLWNFTITGGDAEEGGGMLIEYSFPRVTACSFIGNTATRGGGMFIVGSFPTLTNCTFYQNSASDWGAGIYSDASSLLLADCAFSNNAGTAMYNKDLADAVLIGCTFTDNSGTGICNCSIGGDLTLIDCTFTGNTGNGMLIGGTTITLVNCTFSHNSRGIYNYQSSMTLTNCTFSQNNTSNSGGAIYNEYGVLTTTNCTFIQNTAKNRGGAIFNIASGGTMTNCTFSQNSADYGAVMYSTHYSGATLTNCKFLGNITGVSGGIYNEDQSSTEMTNCIFRGNTAASFGGCVFFNDGGLAITNCTFNQNQAFAGSSVYTVASAWNNPTLANCIIWDNSDVSGESIDGEERTTVTYSNIEGGYEGTGNIDADPLFVDMDNDDYHISAGSPCIDAADNTAVPKGIDTDLDGNPRFVDDPDTKDTGNGDPPIVDMGAYEFQALPCQWDLDSSGSVGASDLLLLLANWGNPYGASDLLALLANWGPCP